ncbi:competence type IV pilus minor pilin ComGD [Alteribacter populi]|uniref:competence type IV pilus minor pilin ComGD n=1 Tax=Alteribacter populi TaxID=2011011 RepID=UPI000BBB2E91|nr:competence type IV pilus minor pilin ComGD [Alteribacter populi]
MKIDLFHAYTEKGYTLIEILVVVSLLSILLLIAVPQLKQENVFEEVEGFFTTLEKDLYNAQMKAITDGAAVFFIFDPIDHSYTIRQGLTTIEKRQFPIGLELRGTSLGYSNLRFLASGNIRQSGTFTFLYEEHLFRLVFVFMRGRFYIEGL